MQLRSYTTKATNLKINEEVSNREYSREFKNTEQRNNIKYGKTGNAEFRRVSVFLKCAQFCAP